MNKSVVTIVIGASGLVAGWIVRSVISQRNELPSQPTIRERMRRFERQLYRDGMQRANTFQTIKQEMENRL